MSEQQPVQIASLFTPFRLLSYTASATVGSLAARFYINDAVYDNLKKTGAFDDLMQTHNQKLGSLNRQAIAGVSDIKGNFAALIRKERQAYFPQIEARMKQMGVRSFADELNIVHRSQRQNAAIIGLTVGSVLLGGILAIADNLERQPSSNER